MRKENAAAAGESRGGGAAATTDDRERSGFAGPVRGDIAGGLASAIATLAISLTLGLLAFAPLGVEHAHLGVRAGLVAAIVGNAVASVFSGTSVTGSGPRTSVTLILAGFVAVLAADPEVASAPELGVPAILALAAFCVAISGALQIAFGMLRLGTVAKFVPYPVVAGFMCGIAVLIVLSQLPHILGVTSGSMRRVSLDWVSDVQPWTAAIAIATAAITGFARWRWARVPASLVGLLLGAALAASIHALAPGAALGPAVGALPRDLPRPDELLAAIPILGVPAVAKHLPALASAAAVLAIIGSLDALLGAAAIDAVANTRSRSNRELVAQGLGNIASALFAGAPAVLSPSQAIAGWHAGGRTRWTGVFAAAVLLVAVVAFAPAIAYVPLAVLAGIMLTVAWSLFDGWTRGLLRRLARGETDSTVRWSAAVVLVVALVTMFVNFVAAVVVGVFLSMAVFIATMNRSVIRAVLDGTARPSRRIYGPEEARRLAIERRRIKLVELEGALFFGSAERLSIEVETLATRADYIVLDLRRVTAIDATGALVLEQLAHRLARGKATMLLAGIAPDGRHGAALVAYGTFVAATTRLWFADADQAIEWAERRVLGASPGENRDIPFEDLAFSVGLDAAEIDALRASLDHQTIAAGATLFRQGDPGDRMFVLARGAISISIRATGNGATRIVTFAPGAVFGEAAMLDGAPRSATAVADEDSVCYVLTRTALDALTASHPALASKLLINLGRHLSSRLRQTTDTLRELADSAG